MKKLINIVCSILIIASYVSSFSMDEEQENEAVCQLGGGCHIVGRKFNIGDQVLIMQEGNPLKGRIATIIEDNPERIEMHKKANNCPGHCIVYSLMMNDSHELAECCQPYLQEID